MEKMEWQWHIDHQIHDLADNETNTVNGDEKCPNPYPKSGYTSFSQPKIGNHCYPTNRSVKRSTPTLPGSAIK